MAIDLKSLDAETLALMRAYAGAEFAEPRVVEVEVFYEYSSNSWDADVFLKEINEAIAKIPPEFRDSAKVELEGEDYGKLRIYYVAPESVETVNKRIAECYAYAKQGQDDERRQFERLKKKYETR